MNMTATAFRECVLAALDELDERTEATEIRRVDTWVERLAKEVHSVQGSFGDGLGERDPDAEALSYGDITVDLGEELAGE